MSELKPCPFCGSQDVVKVIEGTRHPMIYVRCNTCLSMSGWYEAYEENIMINAWNKRRVNRMKNLVMFSEDEYTSMAALIKDTKKEIETIKKYYNSYALCRVHDKLIEILSILTGEGD